MSKYNSLWEHLKCNGNSPIKLNFEEIKSITGFDIDHSFLNYKKELIIYGYQVGKISLKEKNITFIKIDDLKK